MKFRVHDVGHGLCISLAHDNGNVMLWDCGHSDDNRPSEFLPRLGIDSVDCFFVTNFDEDHISDLPNLRTKMPIRSLHRNKSISIDQLRALKLEGGPISNAMESMLDMMGSYTGGPLAPAPEFPGVSYKVFWNSYSDDINDTNNLSLVTIIQCGDTKFIIPGDMELKGWERMLTDTSFTRELSGVDVFIASHHGREGGYCATLFDYCTPNVIIFSDSPIQYATQEMSNQYGQHSDGITFNGAARKVLSTRNDGSLTWTIR